LQKNCIAQRVSVVLNQATTTRVTCLFTTYCRRIGEEGLCGVLISKSAVDFESVFDIEKTFEKMTALFKNKMMVQASTLGPNKHKCGCLRYRGD
jgi:hypothetical protein